MIARPVTLFTSQRADLSLKTLPRKAKRFGCDSLELGADFVERYHNTIICDAIANPVANGRRVDICHE